MIYLVEMWSNKTKPDAYAADGGDCHYVSVVHIASSERAARKWARDNLNYGGNRKDHPNDFFPWHFRVRQWIVDEDTVNIVYSHDRQVGGEMHPRKYHKRNRP